MSHYWILFTFSWLGSVKLQYVKSGEDINVIGDYDTDYAVPIPYVLNQPKADYDNTIDNIIRFSFKDVYQNDDATRLRRTANENIDNTENNEDTTKAWQPNLVDTDKTVYLPNNESKNPPEQETNDTVVDNIKPYPLKRSFNPWGGKRDGSQADQMWSWKRSVKEPSMPKRVRFSPWGGKRSGQVMFRPGNKASRIIFSSSIPELTKIISKYSPTNEAFNMAGFQLLPLLDKRIPIKLFAIRKNVDGRPLRDILPFKDYAEPFSKFKAGHTFTEVEVKKDGKRKVKFNAWGGKRSTPVIGPIWTPNEVNEASLQDFIKENLKYKHGLEDRTKNILESILKGN